MSYHLHCSKLKWEQHESLKNSLQLSTKAMQLNNKQNCCQHHATYDTRIFGHYKQTIRSKPCLMLSFKVSLSNYPQNAHDLLITDIQSEENGVEMKQVTHKWEHINVFWTESSTDSIELLQANWHRQALHLPNAVIETRY